MKALITKTFNNKNENYKSVLIEARLIKKLKQYSYKITNILNS